MRPFRAEKNTLRPPFWLAASNFYVVSIALAAVVFFVVWAILHEASGDTAFFPAGIAASGTVLTAAALRALIISKIRNRIIATQRLERNLAVVAPRNVSHARRKLTIEQNALILNEIRRKSEAAKVLDKYAEGHRETFMLCREYLAISEQELRTAGPGSPRIAALRKGRHLAEELHRYHMLQWTELEVTSLTQESRKQQRASSKIEAAQRALEVIDLAFQHYPAERSLVESADFLASYIAGIKVADLKARAHRAMIKNNFDEASKLYSKALREIHDLPILSDELVSVEAEIDSELKKIRESKS